jgi:hypothetical protein
MDQLTTDVAPAAPADSAPAQQDIQSESATPAAPVDGEGAAPEQDPSQQPPKPEKPSRLQQRFDELTRQRYEEQRAREAAEARLAAIERQQSRSQQFSQIDAKMPQVDQFHSLQDFGMALAQWSAERAAAVAEAQWEQRLQQTQAEAAKYSQQAMEQQQRVMRENVMIEERMTLGAKVYPDFMQALTNPDLPAVRGTPLFDAVLAAENAHHIAYSLAKNPGELDRLLSIRDPMHIAREVFRLDAKFSGNGAASAPPPPPHRNGSSAAPKATKDMTYAEWEKQREAELRAGR